MYMYIGYNGERKSCYKKHFSKKNLKKMSHPVDNSLFFKKIKWLEGDAFKNAFLKQ